MFKWGFNIWLIFCSGIKLIIGAKLKKGIPFILNIFVIFTSSDILILILSGIDIILFSDKLIDTEDSKFNGSELYK